MNKKEFKEFLNEEYKMADSKKVLNEILDNVLEYAGNMEEIEQYNFLCDIIPYVPEIDIRQVYYTNEEDLQEEF